jgi:hypothetical protein
MRRTWIGVAVATVIACACGGGAIGTVGTIGPEPPDAAGDGSGGNPDAAKLDATAPPAFTLCVPLTCANQLVECGPAGDGCGGIIGDCGRCGAGLRCGGPGAPSKCVSPYITCEPKTCAEQAIECGPADHGCGGLILDCGPCDAGTQCGNTDPSTHSKCVVPTPDAPCTPSTCAELGVTCGEAPNGCGGITPNCGQCTGSTSCKNGVCVPACAPSTCKELAVQCGYVADGCGGIIDCGVCPDGLICGLNGRPYECVGIPPF